MLVPTATEGFQRGRKLDKIGCKAQDTAELFFHDMRVPVGSLLGEEDRGFAYLMGELAQERLVQAVRAVASAVAAIGWTVEYASDRTMYGHTLADFQNTRFTLAQLHSEVGAMRVYIDECIRLHVDGDLDAIEAAKAKMVSTQLQGRVMDECLQLFGGWGYMSEYPIAGAFVDARMSRIGGGSIEVMKHIIGRDLFAGRR